jgi:hypothetical protein
MESFYIKFHEFIFSQLKFFQVSNTSTKHMEKFISKIINTDHPVIKEKNIFPYYIVYFIKEFNNLLYKNYLF